VNRSAATASPARCLAAAVGAGKPEPEDSRAVPRRSRELAVRDPDGHVPAFGGMEVFVVRRAPSSRVTPPGVPARRPTATKAVENEVSTRIRPQSPRPHMAAPTDRVPSSSAAPGCRAREAACRAAETKSHQQVTAGPGDRRPANQRQRARRSRVSSHARRSEASGPSSSQTVIARYTSAGCDQRPTPRDEPEPLGQPRGGTPYHEHVGGTRRAAEAARSRRVLEVC